jgi:hypothetical protein
MAGRMRLRRWLIGLMGLLLTTSAAVAALAVPPLTYQATSQIMLLLPPTSRSTGIEVSPFMNQPNGLVNFARAAILEPRGEGFRRSMVESGFTSQFELDAEITTPVVRFSVEGPDPAIVNSTMRELRRRFDDSLRQAQLEEGVPVRRFAHVLEIQWVSAVPLSGDRFRAAGGIGLVGLLLTLLATNAVGRRFSDPGAVGDSSNAPGTGVGATSPHTRLVGPQHG